MVNFPEADEPVLSGGAEVRGREVVFRRGSSEDVIVGCLKGSTKR